MSGEEQCRPPEAGNELGCPEACRVDLHRAAAGREGEELRSTVPLLPAELGLAGARSPDELL